MVPHETLRFDTSTYRIAPLLPNRIFPYHVLTVPHRCVITVLYHNILAVPYRNDTVLTYNFVHIVSKCTLTYRIVLEAYHRTLSKCTVSNLTAPHRTTALQIPKSIATYRTVVVLPYSSVRHRSYRTVSPATFRNVPHRPYRFPPFHTYRSVSHRTVALPYCFVSRHTNRIVSHRNGVIYQNHTRTRTFFCNLSTICTCTGKFSYTYPYPFVFFFFFFFFFFQT